MLGKKNKIKNWPENLWKTDNGKHGGQDNIKTILKDGIRHEAVEQILVRSVTYATGAR
jgi:hypothetical protein